MSNIVFYTKIYVIIVALIFTLFSTFCGTIFPTIFLLLSIYFYASAVRKYRAYLHRQLLRSRDAMPAIMSIFRRNNASALHKLCFGVSFLVLASFVYKWYNKVSAPQGAGASVSIITDVWVEPNTTPMDLTPISSTTVPKDAVAALSRNLCHLKFSNGIKTSVCDMFFVGSNCALIPNHIWEKDDEFSCVVTKNSDKGFNSSFRCVLHKRASYSLPNTDLCLVYVPCSGDWRNTLDFFPLNKIRDIPALVSYRMQDGTLVDGKTYLRFGNQKTTVAHFYGAKYDLSFNTFRGLCMALIVSDSKGACIAGFHIGGLEKTAHGCSVFVTRSEVENAMTQLSLIPGVLLAAHSANVPKKLYDVQFMTSETLHPKSCFTEVSDSNMEVYGSCIGRVAPVTNVVDTVISPVVAEVFGQPNVWSGPPHATTRPWSAGLADFASPSSGLPFDLMEEAVVDYLKPILAAIVLDEIAVQTTALTYEESLCGRLGRKFIGRIVMSTSVGFPLVGNKSQFVEPCDSATFPNGLRFKTGVLEQIIEKEDMLVSGVRINEIFKGTLKDEPTKITKTKVRIFQAGPFALSIILRRVLLPLFDWLSEHQTISEIGVGLNPVGPEWDRLMKHVRTFGDDRVNAGDFKAFDRRMPAQANFAVGYILIQMAKAMNYSERDLAILRSVITEIAYPLIAYNGTLIKLMGSAPSGHNGTAHMNSIANALFARCAFKDMYPNLDFRQHVKLLTYGDDSISTVSRFCEDFNHISMGSFLKLYGMEYTMPDKTSQPTKYLNFCDVDFLKRKDTFIPELGVSVGALDNESIMKSLHSILKSKHLTNVEVSAFNLEGASREWFLHGKGVFDEKQKLLQLVAQRANIQHMCEGINVSFEDRVLAWKSNYIGEVTP